ncbi:hypothetical protein SK128_026938 [Halocaridina rubra]|uniref:Uncharacterized protein n=1 Tax=Halocaridina rubra TaxID=373956 RepID=A0AAN8WXG4_HALRR
MGYQSSAGSGQRYSRLCWCWHRWTVLKTIRLWSKWGGWREIYLRTTTGEGTLLTSRGGGSTLLSPTHKSLTWRNNRRVPGGTSSSSPLTPSSSGHRCPALLDGGAVRVSQVDVSSESLAVPSGGTTVTVGGVTDIGDVIPSVTTTNAQVLAPPGDASSLKGQERPLYSSGTKSPSLLCVVLDD